MSLAEDIPAQLYAPGIFCFLERSRCLMLTPSSAHSSGVCSPVDVEIAKLSCALMMWQPYFTPLDIAEALHNYLLVQYLMFSATLCPPSR